MCRKADECLQQLKGTRGAEEAFFFFFCRRKENSRDWALTTWMNEPHCNIFLRHCGSFMSCMAYAWNISPRGDKCVCVLSIIGGADECEGELAPTSSMSLTVSCWGKCVLSHLHQHDDMLRFDGVTVWPKHQYQKHESIASIVFFPHCR